VPIALNKILIIRFSSIGDIVLASPLIRVLRSAYPSSQIDFLVKAEYAELVKFNPHLSSVIELKTVEQEELKSLKNEIKLHRYDAIIDIHNSLRSQYLRWFAGVENSSVVNKRVITRFILVKFKWNYYRSIVSVAERYLETVKKFGIQNDGLGLEIFIPDETISTANSMMDKYQLSRFEYVIGVVPSARHFTKCWLPERFVEFGVEIAQKRRVKIIIFGSKEEHDYCGDIAQMINTKLGSNAAESLAGKLTLLETAAVLDICNLVLTNDTGVMHLAAARKRKIVAIFGSTVQEFGFFPYDTENLVIERKGLSCRPCSHIGLAKCPRGHFRCMKDIQVNDVITAAQKLLTLNHV
jgi:heptosyltransferase-2